MASMKLTHWMRDSIITRLIDYRFGQEQLALQQNKIQLANDIYNDVLTEKDRQLMSLLPPGWLPEASHINAQFGNVSCYESFYFSEDYSKTKPLPEKYSGCAKVYELSHPFAVRVFENSDKKNNLDERIKVARRQARTAMASVSTTKQLIDAWPEIAPFISSVEGGAIQLPAIPKAELNALFGLPVAA